MARSSLPSRQMRALRQTALLIAILVLMLFAYKYARGMERIRASRAELTHIDEAVEETRQEREAIQQAAIDADSPAAVERVAKEELGWVRADDKVYIVVDESETAQDGGVTSARPTGPVAEPTPPPWQQWWVLLVQDTDTP